jgi:hypothetical protein
VFGVPTQVSVRLRNPNGAVISPTNVPSGGTYSIIDEGGGVIPMTAYSLPSPVVGEWTVMIDATAQTLPQGGDVNFALTATSDITLRAEVVDATPTVNRPLTVRTQLSNGTNPITAPVKATLRFPDGTSQSVELLDDGQHNDVAANDGIYGYIFLPRMVGVYGASIMASGSTQNRNFTRYTSWAAPVEATPAPTRIFLPRVSR